MRNLKLVLVLLLLVTLAVTLVGCGGEQQNQGDKSQGEKKVVLKLGGIQSAEDTATKAMIKMAELAKEKSGGTLEIEVFPASQLGDAISQMEAVFMGSQDMFVDAQSWISQFVPDKQVESLFFAFNSEEHFRAYLNSDINKELEQKLVDEHGARVIANNWLRAPRVMLSKKPIKSLEDMQGLKMRVPEIQTYLESVQALGAKPTQIPWGEVYLALTQGLVEACEGPLDAVYSMKFYEGAPHITMTNHIRDGLAVIINEKKFQSLSEKQQKALVEAAQEAGDWYTQQVKAKLDTVVEKMKAEGTKFYEIDTAPFVEIMMKTAEKLENQGMWRKGLFAEIQELDK